MNELLIDGDATLSVSKVSALIVEVQLGTGEMICLALMTASLVVMAAMNVWVFVRETWRRR